MHCGALNHALAEHLGTAWILLEHPYSFKTGDSKVGSGSWRRRRDVWRTEGFWAGVACAVMVALAVLTGVAQRLEYRFYDAATQSTLSAGASDIAIVGIDAATMAELGPLPWPREVHASMVERLGAAGTKAIVYTPALPEQPAGRALAYVQQMGEVLARSGDSSPWRPSWAAWSGMRERHWMARRAWRAPSSRRAMYCWLPLTQALQLQPLHRHTCCAVPWRGRIYLLCRRLPSSTRPQRWARQQQGWATCIHGPTVTARSGKSTVCSMTRAPGLPRLPCWQCSCRCLLASGACGLAPRGYGSGVWRFQPIQRFSCGHAWSQARRLQAARLPCIRFRRCCPARCL